MFTSLSVTRNDEKNRKTVPHNASKRNLLGDQKIHSDLNNLMKILIQEKISNTILKE